MSQASPRSTVLWTDAIPLDVPADFLRAAKSVCLSYVCGRREILALMVSEDVWAFYMNFRTGRIGPVEPCL